MDDVKSRIIRVQADRLALAMGFPEKTYFEESVIQQVRDAVVKSEIFVGGRKIVVTPRMKALAGILWIKILTSKESV